MFFNLSFVNGHLGGLQRTVNWKHGYAHTTVVYCPTLSKGYSWVQKYFYFWVFTPLRKLEEEQRQMPCAYIRSCRYPAFHWSLQVTPILWPLPLQNPMKLNSLPLFGSQTLGLSSTLLRFSQPRVWSPTNQVLISFFQSQEFSFTVL